MRYLADHIAFYLPVDKGDIIVGFEGEESLLLHTRRSSSNSSLRGCRQQTINLNQWAVDRHHIVICVRKGSGVFSIVEAGLKSPLAMATSMPASL
jgi:hypothetical protein